MDIPAHMHRGILCPSATILAARNSRQEVRHRIACITGGIAQAFYPHMCFASFTLLKKVALFISEFPHMFLTRRYLFFETPLAHQFPCFVFLAVFLR